MQNKNVSTIRKKEFLYSAVILILFFFFHDTAILLDEFDIESCSDDEDTVEGETVTDASGVEDQEIDDNSGTRTETIVARATYRRSVKPLMSLYSQMDTNGEIGSVHTGKVWMNTLLNENGFFSLQDFDSNKMFYGLSFYSPTQKVIQKVDYRKTSRYNKFLTLPSTAQKLFEADDSLDEKFIQIIFKELIKKIKELIGLKKQQLGSLLFDRWHRVRFEFFCTTESMDDIEFPYLKLDEMIRRVKHEDLNQTMKNQIKCVLHPLENLIFFLRFQEREGVKVQNMFRNVTSDEKTTILYALEKVIDSLEILKHQKRGILRQIEMELKGGRFVNHNKNLCSGIPPYFVTKVQGDKRNWFAIQNPNIVEDRISQDLSDTEQDGPTVYENPPANYNDVIPSNVSTNPNENYYYHIKSVVYHIQRIDDVTRRLKLEDMTKVPKNYQNLVYALNGISSLPKLEVNMRMRMKQAYFEFTMIEQNKEVDRNRPIPIIFPDPEYRMDFIREKNETEINKFFDILIKILFLAYDATWVGIFKNISASLKRKYPGTKINGTIDLENIPRTKHEYDSSWGKKPEINEGESLSDYKNLIIAPMLKDFVNEIPTVTNASILIALCFAMVDSNVSNPWNSLTVVRLYTETIKFICSVEDFFWKKRGDYPSERYFMWRKEYFDERMFS